MRRRKTGDQALGARIRAKRRMLGLTQVELARRTRLSQNYLSQVETGSVALSAEGLRLLARVLEEDEGYLLRGAAGVPHELETMTNELIRSISEKRKDFRDIASLRESELRDLAAEMADFLAARLRRLRE